MALKFKIETPEQKRRKALIINYSLKTGAVAISIILLWLFFRSVVFDSRAPVITIISPENNTTINAEEIEFKYTVSDSSEISLCQLFLRDNLLANISSKKSEVQSFKANISNGKHEFQISCTDKSVLKNRGSSEKRIISIITPLKLKKITKIEAPELKEGVLNLYSKTSKDNLGFEVAQVLPKNAGYTINSSVLEGHLAIGLWGKPNLASQKIIIYSENESHSIYLPEYKNATNLVLYISDDGSTYHSFSSKNYNKAQNNGRELPDMNWNEALNERYLARRYVES